MGAEMRRASIENASHRARSVSRSRSFEVNSSKPEPVQFLNKQADE